MDYTGKKALVLGLGESGLAMARWLAGCGAAVRVADTRVEPPGLAVLKREVPSADFVSGVFTAALLQDIDMVAASPGLVPDTDLAEIMPEAAGKGIPLVSEIELFARALAGLKEGRGYHPKVIAVTGTNGKTTVSSLIGKMCERAGKPVRVAGNISPAVLDVLREALAAGDLPEIWVLELSSFQLWSTASLDADAAVVLNVTQDHLDWHGSMAAYADAKKRIFGPSGTWVLNRDDSTVMSMALPEKRIVTFGLGEPVNAGDFGIHDNRGLEWLCVLKTVGDEEPLSGRRKNAELPLETRLADLMPAGALRVRGRHNAGNALAALALCTAIGLPMAPLLHALKDYRGEPHRVEPVMTVSGVSYIDDSKGTNVGATVAAVLGLGAETGEGEQRLLLIAGGDGKDQDFSLLAEPVSRFVRSVFLIGRDAGLIGQALADTGADIAFSETLEGAVDLAAKAAREGDVVLLSPACASMDMFKNYAHRAEVFVSAVREIALSRGEVMP